MLSSILVIAASTTTYVGPLALRSPSKCNTACVRTPLRVSRPTASAALLPAASTALGLSLLRGASVAATKSDAAVLASTGLLAVFNLAVTDNARFASAKRAIAIYTGRTSLPGAALKQLSIAKKWKSIVSLQLLGQFAGLVWMARATCSEGILRGATIFMAANVLFFLRGAAGAKHDRYGLPAPIPASKANAIMVIDGVLCTAAAVGSVAAAGTTLRASTSYLFALGAMIGAVEGLPMWLKAAGKLVKGK